MKKVILSMMLATALIAGGDIYAQTQADATTGATTQKENVNKGRKGDRKGNKEARGNKEAKGKRFNPFDGIQLTEEQQQKLQVLRQGLGPVKLTPEQQAKIKENKNLTAEQKKQLKQEKKAKKLEAKKNYLKGVKETLTPDQYVIFLENCYLKAQTEQPKQGGMKKGGKKQGGNQGHHGMKPGKQKVEKKN